MGHLGTFGRMSETLYERLGGQDAIEAVVDEFYDRVVADDQVAHYFDDVDMQRQRAHQTQFISAVAGGPVEYTGADMEAAHDDLGITKSDFDAIATHLEAALEQFDVDVDDREAVLTAISEYEDAIVTATA
ncbi:globin [Natronorubrum sulfidifaciens JCM 14089]|uniref:Globin n=2 Tax=Natronorubrum sulfidifaciens TaxID=388259 RepID=L9WA01_9EURY|nr:globin [Natronorubrum sulfidifaciens JCM 14089]